MRSRSPSGAFLLALLLFALARGPVGAIPPDADGDGLANDEEIRIGTNPYRADSDGDGLLDGWEVHGLSRYGFHEPLPEYGADPLRKDVFVEIDWMENPADGGRANAIAAYLAAIDVWRVFRRSGTHIEVHFDLGPEIEAYVPEELRVVEGGPDFRPFRTAPDPGKVVPYVRAFSARPFCSGQGVSKSLYGFYNDPRYFRPSRRNLFYYVVFADKDAREPENLHPFSDAFADEEARRLGLHPSGIHVGAVFVRPEAGISPELRRFAHAADLLHELGHAFGLGHGGVTPEGLWDNRNNKPNYVSVMNHRYQLWGVDSSGGSPLADFSHGLYLPLRENALLEPLGMGPVPNAHVLENLGVRHLEATPFPSNLDWDGDGGVDFEPIRRDLDSDGAVTADLLTDHDDWGYLLRRGFAGVGRRAFAGCGLTCARGRDVVRVPADLDGDGRTELLLVAGGRFTVIAPGAGLEVRSLASGLSIRGPTGFEPWILTFDDRVIACDLDGDGAEELFLSRGGEAAVAGWAGEGLTLRWRGTEARGLRAETPSWVFDGADRCHRLEPAAGTPSAIVCERAGRVGLLVWDGGELRTRWRSESLTESTGASAVDVAPGRRDKDGRATLLVRGERVFAEIRVAGGYPFERADTEGTIPPEDPAAEGWNLGPYDCVHILDADGDGGDDYLLHRADGIAIVRDTEGGLRVAWSAPSLPGIPHPARFSAVETGDLLPGRARHIVFATGNRTLVCVWSEEAKALRPYADTEGPLAIFDRQGTWPLDGSERVLVGRFLAASTDTILFQGRERLAVAGLAHGRLVALRTFSGAVGAWTLSSEDSLIPVEADGDGVRELSVRNGSVLGFLDLSNPNSAAAGAPARFDLEEGRMEPVALFTRGDANRDGFVDISDAVALLEHLFLRTLELPCPDAADTDDSGSLDISDAIRLLRHLFTEGGELPPPRWPQRGFDPTQDALDCDGAPLRG